MQVAKTNVGFDLPLLIFFTNDKSRVNSVSCVKSGSVNCFLPPWWC